MLIDLECDIFCEDDDINPLKDENYICIGNIGDFLGDDYPYYRYWVFINLKDRYPEMKFYVFWDCGNGWWSGEYFIVNNFTQLQKEIEEYSKKYDEEFEN